MATSGSDDNAKFAFQHGACKVILKQGDLLSEEDVNVRVIPTPDNGKLSGSGYPLYESYYKSLNEKLKKETDTFSKNLRQGEPPQLIESVRPVVMLTPTPYFQNQKPALKMLQKTYLTCLRLAADKGYQSIAFPTIGCGASGFQTKDVADTIYQAVAEFERSKKGSLNEIRIVIYKKEVYNDFVNIFFEFSQDRARKLKQLATPNDDVRSSEVASRRDEAASRQRQANNAKDQDDYDDDFDDGESDKRQRDSRERQSNLNPNVKDFKPQNKNQSRPARLYRLSNNKTELHILQGDILKTKVDAIVNAANEEMLGGGGVDGVIHRAAGNELLKACKAHKKIYHQVRLPTGRSRILLSYDMSKTTHYIINTSGPRYDDAPPDQCRKELVSCYKTSLALANLYDLETVAYTAISCGIFGYPIDEGAQVALQTVDQEAGSMAEITFVLKEDEIYDAWVNQAKRLGFTSLDNVDAEETSTPSRLSDDKKDTTKKENQNGKSDRRRVIDGSTPAGAKNESAVGDDRSSNRSRSGSRGRKSPKKRGQDDRQTDDDPKRDSKSTTPKDDNPDVTPPPNGSPNKNTGQKEDKKADSSKSSTNNGGGRGRGRDFNRTQL